MRYAMIVAMMIGMTGCVSMRENAPSGGLFPMWASDTCWGHSAWKRCQAERMALDVREGSFVSRPAKACRVGELTSR